MAQNFGTAELTADIDNLKMFRDTGKLIRQWLLIRNRLERSL